VLNTARSVDDSARISSIARWEHDDSTLLKVSTESATPFKIADVLRRRWPLATVSIVQNVISGHSEAQVLVPSSADQIKRANDMAKESSTALWLSLLVRVLRAAATICFGAIVVRNVFS
tara:strand:- start:72 stop:428 length:357 start_codon:yes stop_codon:yes gene_type:complete